ncbi:MAG: aldo/keto reductase [Planctomycetes bacterium]|nr:aldo/keto reductase [Planctomycetota bacterium]
MTSADTPVPLPTRPLGRTGHAATLFALGGEGVLRTHGRGREAAAVIARALDLGVNYCDTAPAYASSQDYYGAALGERRRQVFLASKTHERGREGSLRLLDDSLRRLRTDHLDLWQLHDLRTMDEVEAIFSKGGAIQALTQARDEKRVRFLGLTGHHDPAVLLEAMRRFDFDAVLVALNAADAHRRSFLRTVLPEAARRGMGVIAMKVYAAGELVAPNPRTGSGPLAPEEALGYVLSQPGVSCAAIGCRTPEEVEANAEAARRFQPLPEAALRSLEERTRPEETRFTSYKRTG